MKKLTELEQAYAELGKEIEKLKAKKHQYPIYCRSKHSTLVVKFTGLKEGEVMVQHGGYDVQEACIWTPHIDTDYWQKLTVCPTTGFFDGQLVLAWDDGIYLKVIGFYDAVNQRLFRYEGTRDGGIYAKYLPFEGNYPDWAIEAFNTLKLESE